MSAATYDVVIVGAGAAGNTIAWQLGLAGKKVLVLEAGLAVPSNRVGYLENFYLSLAKTPESPYPPLPNNGAGGKGLFPLPDPATQPAPRATVLMIGQKPDQSYMVQDTGGAVPGPTGIRGMPFASSYERNGGGTSWHWLGTSLRLVPHDLRMQSTYQKFTDWPVSYDELQALYGQAEAAIGVAASVAQQAPLQNAIGLSFPAGYNYPMGPIPTTMVDQAIASGIAGLTVSPDAPADPKPYPVFVTPTPAGRNSEPYQNRRVCAGNTNCIPICPIQAKWDPTVTLGSALDTGNVTVQYQTVATNVKVDGSNNVVGIDYLAWTQDANGKISATPGTAVATNYVLAAHAIENAKLLLMSNNRQGVANHSDQVGRNLMDHVLYLSWALSAPGQPVFPYRGPLATAGIESLRDGAFRAFRSAFRMEIGNEGWNFAVGDPDTTLTDFVNGLNFSAVNPGKTRLGGLALAQKLNSFYTRQFRIGCLFDQAPQPENRVTVDTPITDGLGLPRPVIAYGLDEYTLKGFKAARAVCSDIYKRMGATEFTADYAAQVQNKVPGYFNYDGVNYRMFGAGHIMGTHRMGTDPDYSVVDGNQRSHDCPNLWIVGSGSFPTVGTANPTLTIVAMAIKTASSLLSTLG